MRGNRRHIITLTLTTLLILAAAPAPALAAYEAPAAPVTERGPIRILGDGDFTAANGVVAGSGTAADPYVISGWRIEATAGHAIEIRHVSRDFVVTGNVLRVAGAGHGGVVVEDAAGAASSVTHNLITHEWAGVAAIAASPAIRNNSISGPAGATGILLEAFVGEVTGNEVRGHGVAVSATAGAPTIRENALEGGAVGVALRATDAATVADNVVTRFSTAAVSVAGGDATVRGNRLRESAACVRATDASVTVDANDMWGCGAAVRLTRATAAVSSNAIAAGGAGVVATGSDVEATGNTLSALTGDGFRLTDSGGRIAANLVDRARTGVALEASRVALESNTLTNNEYGLSIPYDSRQSIALMAGNVVNGQNVDGATAPSEKALFWRDANVHVAGGAFDAGFSDGYHGATTAQGGVVLYDVDTATITGSHIAHQAVGVRAVNSFNVNVVASTLVNNGCGVVLEGTVGAVKDSNITLDIDPPGTCGVHAVGGVALILNNTIARMDAGIVLEGRVVANASGNLLVDNVVGVDAEGYLAHRGDDMRLADNTVLRGKVGMRLRFWGGVAENNTVRGAAEAAVLLDSGASPVLAGNRLEASAAGVVDARGCAAFVSVSCSSVTATGNLFLNHTGWGLDVNGDAALEGNLFLGNGDGGARVDGEVTAEANAFLENGGHGAVFNGGGGFRANVAAGNDGDGVRVRGVAHFRGDAFVHNGQAGLHVTGPLVVALEVNVSHNLDGIVADTPLPDPEAPTVDPVQPPALPGLFVPGQLLAMRPQPDWADPLYVHRSDIVGNTRNAIRATPHTVVNATHNWWGSADGPRLDLEVVGDFGNTVSPHVRFAPYYTSGAKTATGPGPLY